MVGFGLEAWMLAIGAAAGFAVYTVILEYGMSWADIEQSVAMAAAFYSTLIVTVGFWVLALTRGIPAGTFTVGNLWPFLVAGIAYPALFRFLYFEGVDRVGASITGALMGAYPAVSVLLAVIVLGQNLGLVSGSGIALIIGGVVLLQFTQESEADGDIEDIVTEKLVTAEFRDLLYPIAAMLFTGGAFVLIDYGLTGFPDPIVATAVTQTPALLLFTGWAVITGSSGGYRVGRAALGAFVLGGGFNFLAWLANFFALQLGDVITVVPLLNTMPLLIMALTYGIQREVPRSGRVLTAVVAIVAGASLVQIGS